MENNMENERYINAYDFSETIENLDITVAGKPARWNDAKYTVLKEIAEAPDAEVVPKSVIEKIFNEFEEILSDNFHVDCQIGDWIEDYYDVDVYDDFLELRRKYEVK